MGGNSSLDGESFAGGRGSPMGGSAPLGALSMDSMEPEEETVQGLKRKLEDLQKEHNELKQKVSDLQLENFNQGTEKKALTYHLQCKEKENQKLLAENESLRETKRQMMSIGSGSSAPRRCGKTTKALLQNVEEKYVGISLHIESMLSSWSMREVAELQQYTEKPRREWMCRGNAVTESGVIVAGGEMVAPFPPQSLAETGGFFVSSSSSLEMSLRRMVEEELKEDKWSSITATDESREAVIRIVSSNGLLQMSLKRNLSDTASYKKRIARDCLFTSLKYDKLITKNGIKTEMDKDQKRVQINEARRKLMKHVPGTMEYEMGWWRRCKDEVCLMFGTVEGMEFNVDTQSIAVSGSALSPNCEESQENGNEEEEKYGLFRNESAKTVWAQFKNVKKGQSSVTLVAQVVGEEEGEKETPESTILQLARLDAWVMTVLKCMVAEETRG